MPKPDTKQSTITLRIVPGPVSPQMREQWRKLWVRLIAEARESEK